MALKTWIPTSWRPLQSTRRNTRNRSIPGRNSSTNGNWSRISCWSSKTTFTAIAKSSRSRSTISSSFFPRCSLRSTFPSCRSLWKLLKSSADSERRLRSPRAFPTALLLSGRLIPSIFSRYFGWVFGSRFLPTVTIWSETVLSGIFGWTLFILYFLQCREDMLQSENLYQSIPLFSHERRDLY